MNRIARRKVAVALAVLGLVAVGGCVSHRGGDGGGGGAPLSAAEFPDAFAEALCGQLFRCCTAGFREARLNDYASPAPATEPECIAVVAEAVGTRLAARPSSSYDAAAAQRCVEVTAGPAICGELNRSPSECAAVFVASTAGDPCDPARSGCGNLDYCDAATATCQPRSLEGAACDDVGVLPPCYGECVDGRCVPDLDDDCDRP